MLSRNNLLRRSKRSLPDVDVRSQIARDLHDGVIQDLVAFGYSLDSIIAHPDLTPPLRSEIRQVRLDATEIIRKLREDIFQLRQISHELFASLAQLFEKSEITFRAIGEVPPLNASDISELLPVLREVALNTIHHSHAKSFTIQSELYNDHWFISLSDDGVGRATIKEKHFGLTNIKERIASRGGSLTMESNSDGTQFRIVIPLRDVPKKDDSDSGSR